MDDSPPPFDPKASECDPAQLEFAKNKRVLAGIMGILFGALGVHKFVLGYRKAGIIMLVVSILGSVVTACLCLPGSGVLFMWLIGAIEGIIYLSKSDEEFCRTYVCKKRDWF